MRRAGTVVCCRCVASCSVVLCLMLSSLASLALSHVDNGFLFRALCFQDRKYLSPSVPADIDVIHQAGGCRILGVPALFVS